MDIMISNQIEPWELDNGKVRYANEEIEKLLTHETVLHFDNMSELRDFLKRIAKEVIVNNKESQYIERFLWPHPDEDMLMLRIYLDYID